MSEAKKNAALPDKEEVLQNEMSLLQGLIEAGNFKKDESLQERVIISRNGKQLFSFTVRALDEEEQGIIRKKCTKMWPNPAGRKLPPIEGNTDWVKFRSWKIYMATIDEDKKRIWDNQEFLQRFDVLTAADLVDKVLRPGEKSAVCEIIDRLSGEGDAEVDVEGNEEEPVTLEDYAKN